MNVCHCRATIEIGIVDKEEYERKVTFSVQIYDPIWVKKLGGECVVCVYVTSHRALCT